MTAQVELGQIRIRTFIHPDSINVRVWQVEQLTEASGKYAKPGDVYWNNVNASRYRPYTSIDDAIARKELLEGQDG